ncbi:MAG: hypothetical protein ACT4N8_10755 [Sphingosinicella sp.]|uniref:hypothetical protein n=1 Tax=Sphingosinicella sp. TaxID=1917971 RepID=UPI0040381C91
MTQFTVTHLDDDRLNEAYPLVRAAAPNVGPAQWRDYAGWLRWADGGVLAAFAAGSTLHGIAAYCRDDSLRYGRSLRVDMIVTFELGRTSPVRVALCEALEQLAREKHCDSLAVVMPSRGYSDPVGAKSEGWSALGFTLDSVCFRKALTQAEADRHAPLAEVV